MGVSIENSGQGELLIHGAGRSGLRMPADQLNAENSGTTMTHT